jgi:hypothetical protein
MNAADRVLKRLVSSSEWKPDWQDVAARARIDQESRSRFPLRKSRSQPSGYYRRTRLGSRRPLLICVGLMLLALTASIPALAITHQWMFGGHGPTLTTPEFTVASGTISGTQWSLHASGSSEGGMCMSVSTSSGGDVGGGCETTVAMVTNPGPGNAATSSLGYNIVSLPSSRGSVLFGPIANGVSKVSIRLAGGEDVLATIVPSPDGLNATGSFYYATFNSSQTPSAVSAASANGSLIQEISIPRL